ncbi:MAG: SH3 domain-containing protein [Treponema sp.]|nr:SH3 domain-containing protein [Treponema sp.]
MFEFVKNAFRVYLGVILWVNLIFCAVAGAIVGVLVGNMLVWGGGEVEGYGFAGFVIGVLIGLLQNVVFGGLGATVISIDKKMQNFARGASPSKNSYIVNKTVNLRSEPDSNSSIVTVLSPGVNLIILEKGGLVKIGDITAPWVKVKSEDGETGWCFSGALEKAPG